MKKLLFFSLAILFFAAQSNAQECTPNTDLTDEDVVDPTPFTDDNPLGGISDTACLNNYFEFSVSLSPTDQFPLTGADIANIQLPLMGAIDNLPTGMQYNCNPPDCIIPSDTVGCILIYGTPTDPADVGVHDLVINGQINFDPAGVFPIAFPNALIAPGNYFLHVKEEGSSNCLVSTNELEQFVRITNRPNPFSGITTIDIQSDISGTFAFAVTNTLGQQIHSQKVQILEGENQINFDGSQLAEGMYIYTISDGQSRIAKTMIISRR